MESPGQPAPGSTPGSDQGSPPPPSWQSTPQPPAAQTQVTSGASWDSPPRAGAIAGPAGFTYADVPNRIFAYIIDAIIVGIATTLVNLVLPDSVQFTPGTGTTGIGGVEINAIGVVLETAASLIVSAAYFIFFWTSQRATLGMRVLGLQVGNETDGATLTTGQAATRWALLALPGALGIVVYVLPALGIVLGLAALIWYIALLVTTAQSPTKQGLHDRYAHTVMVKATRSAG